MKKNIILQCIFYTFCGFVLLHTYAYIYDTYFPEKNSPTKEPKIINCGPIETDQVKNWPNKQELNKNWDFLKPNVTPKKKDFKKESKNWNAKLQISINRNEYRYKRASEKNLRLKEKLEECEKLEDLEKNLQEKKELHKNMLSDKTLKIQELSKNARTAQTELVKIKNLLENKLAIKNSNDLLKNDIKNLTEEIRKYNIDIKLTNE